LEEIASDNWQLECSQMEWRRNPARSASPGSASGADINPC